MIRFKIILTITVFLSITVWLTGLIMHVSSIWYFLPLCFCLLSIVVGSFSMSYNVFLKAFTNNTKVSENMVALTFDDGPNAAYTPKVLELLSKYGAKATFFCIGKHVDKNEGIIRDIDYAKHDVGNHSYDHNNAISFSSSRKWHEEIVRTDESIERITGNKPRFFRPPFGVTTPNLAKALKITGHQAMGWNIRSFDTSTKNPNEVLDRIFKQIKPGSVILLHDTHNRIPYILEHLLLYLKNHNYKSVTLNTLLNEPS